MARFQMSINVRDAEAAVAFYTKLFGVGPAKQRPGYELRHSVVLKGRHAR